MSKSVIIDERDELMVSPTGSLPTFRKAHFIKPTVLSIEGPSLKLPPLSASTSWPMKVDFSGWGYPSNKKWKIWLEIMHSRYSDVWKEAGIYKAIMGSSYKIPKDTDFFYGVAERWCSDTNTFVFPWGESTITLEDILILSGFSVLGFPVLYPLDSTELIGTQNILEHSCRNTKALGIGSFTHSEWCNLFMGRGSSVEHEAFLSLWLCMCVFPDNHYNRVGSHVFTIAIHLAKGRRIALAPAVLASIYRDLGLLRSAMVASTQLTEYHSYIAVTLWARLDIVLAWAWERFPSLQPKPKSIEKGIVRMARWSEVDESEVGLARPAISSAGANFLWRPYTMAVDNWQYPLFYKETGVSINVDDLSEELESFARGLISCQLIGLDCQEIYNPHRVSMQFGYDQDLPRWILKENLTPQVAWSSYSKSWNDDEVIYFPARLFEADVSYKYLQWWRKSVTCPVDDFQGLVKAKRSLRRHLKYRDVLECGNDLHGWIRNRKPCEDEAQSDSSEDHSSNKQLMVLKPDALSIPKKKRREDARRNHTRNNDDDDDNDDEEYSVVRSISKRKFKVYEDDDDYVEELEDEEFPAVRSITRRKQRDSTIMSDLVKARRQELVEKSKYLPKPNIGTISAAELLSGSYSVLTDRRIAGYKNSQGEEIRSVLCSNVNNFQGLITNDESPSKLTPATVADIEARFTRISNDITELRGGHFIDI